MAKTNSGQMSEIISLLQIFLDLHYQLPQNERDFSTKWNICYEIKIKIIEQTRNALYVLNFH